MYNSGSMPYSLVEKGFIKLLLLLLLLPGVQELDCILYLCQVVVSSFLMRVQQRLGKAALYRLRMWYLQQCM